MYQETNVIHISDNELEKLEVVSLEVFCELLEDENELDFNE